MNNKAILLVGIALIAIGFFKPDLSSVIPSGGKTTITVPVIEVAEPTDPELKEKALKVAELLSGPNSKQDAAKLSELWDDLASLIAMDEENEIVKTTAEIREANSVSGQLMNLKLQNEYEGLAEAAKNIVVDSIGDDNIIINEEIRNKAVDAFRALSWGAYQGAK